MTHSSVFNGVAGIFLNDKLHAGLISELRVAKIIPALVPTGSAGGKPVLEGWSWVSDMRALITGSAKSLHSALLVLLQECVEQPEAS